MKFTQQEIAVLWHAMSRTNEDQPRKFPDAQMGAVIGIYKAMKEIVKDDAIPVGEHDLKLTTDEKKLAKDIVSEMSWTMQDAETAQSLKEKLNK